MWEVWLNLCNLHHFDSETSHHFVGPGDSNVSSFQEHCHIKINLKIIMIYMDEMYPTVLHQKEQWYH